MSNEMFVLQLNEKEKENPENADNADEPLNAKSMETEVKENKEKDGNEQQSVIHLELEQNIYTFALQLLQMDDNNKKDENCCRKYFSCCFPGDQNKNRKWDYGIFIIILSLAMLIQYGCFVILLLNGKDFEDNGKDNDFSLKCDNPNHNYKNSTNINYIDFNDCSSHLKWSFAEPSAFILLTKLLAAGMVFIYILQPTLSLSKLVLIPFSKQNIKKKSNEWGNIGLFVDCFVFQAITVAVGIWVMQSLIFSGTELVDILATPIGFIIILEIDDKAYELVSYLNPYNKNNKKYYNINNDELDEDDFFRFELDEEIMKNTIFSFISLRLYEFISIILLALLMAYTPLLEWGLWKIHFNDVEDLPYPWNIVFIYLTYPFCCMIGFWIAGIPVIFTIKKLYPKIKKIICCQS